MGNPGISIEFFIFCITNFDIVIIRVDYCLSTTEEELFQVYLLYVNFFGAVEQIYAAILLLLLLYHIFLLLFLNTCVTVR